MAETASERVIIVGAGMAGISAALWCVRLGLAIDWLEAAAEWGGQLSRINGPIRDYPGLSAPNGAAFREALRIQLDEAGLRPMVDTPVVEADVRAREIRLADGSRRRAAGLIVATGVAPRRLGVPGEETLRGLGVTDSATRDLAALAGKVVAVIGGGDGAIENASILARVCPRVILIHRGAELRARAELVRRATCSGHVQVKLTTRVTAIRGAAGVEAIELAGPAGVELEPVEAVVVKIGVTPVLGPFAGALACDDAGYVRVGADQATSVPLVYAAGDVCNAMHQSLPAAAGQGMIAAKALERALAAQRAARR